MSFRPIEGDERATTAAFEEFVGGRGMAESLDRLYHSSYPVGTAYDRLHGRARSKTEVFRAKARREGFKESEIDAYLVVAG